ncbi:response regulator [Shewanella baltica]|uniref:hybrid sensor histidine kinase/response regulator n=1 Tax=Shewanella baltica TaxID=62322 RepID=UPI00217E4DB9|nr:ATP-binding protein [Shewanella baltica]MCS6125972.1 response regulator [Shewanella baltica]MCS6138666.1 response regulator [Shewanella baltica]MCS6144534.1 response regulator [Shewanella baltica]MCS6169062.1 response regulator [Shewanella baltica]MCS6185964.1 response regulator [Shewanella baltica]
MSVKYSACINMFSGLWVTILVLWLTLSHSLYEFDAIYDKKAQAVFTSSRDMFLQHKIMLDALKSFFHASSKVTSQEFEIFAKDLLKIKSAVAFTLTPSLELAYISDKTMATELKQIELVKDPKGELKASLANYTLAGVAIDKPNMPYLVYAVSHQRILARIEQEQGVCITYQFEQSFEQSLLQNSSCNLKLASGLFSLFNYSDSQTLAIPEYQTRVSLQVEYQVPQKEVIELIVIILLIAALGIVLSFLLYFKSKNQQVVEQIKLDNRAKLAVLSSINHEIRTPINAILGYSRMLKKALSQPQELDKIVDKMAWSANLLYSVAENTLNYSKAETGQLKLNLHSVNLHEYVGNIQDYYRAFSATSGKRLHIVVSESLPQFIELDGTKLFQLMTNIINNAFKYSTGSEVHCYMDLHLKANAKNQRPVLRVLIRDFGDGMSKEAQRALVDPFMHAANSPIAATAGMGLGLYTCNRLLEQIGGRFRLRSQKGKGTTVLLHFPCQLSAAKERLTLQYDQQKVLIIDDNLFNLEICRAMLEHYHFQTFSTDNTEQALKMLVNHLPQIVIVDYRLQEMNGLQLVRQMQQVLQNLVSDSPIEHHCRFFLLSANDCDDIPELASFPEVHFMQKPFSAEVFLSKLAVKE